VIDIKLRLSGRPIKPPVYDVRNKNDIIREEPGLFSYAVS